MIYLTVDKRYQASKIEKMLTRAAEATLENQGVDTRANLSLVITGDQKLKKLNVQFLGENSATDVLSFPSGEFGPQFKIGYLGDVVISLPRARAQAKAGGHSLHAELQLLAVHGTLHLLGHDHGAAQKKSSMWVAQDEILDELGVSIRSPLAESAKPES